MGILRGEIEMGFAACIMTLVGRTLGVAILFIAVGCNGKGNGGGADLSATAGGADLAMASTDLASGSVDAGGGCPGDSLPKPACEYGGAPGTCMSASACGAIADHTAEPSTLCTAAGQSCCIDAPDTADNPPTPSGWKLMTSPMVTPAMTSWAVMILHDPVCYPMWSTTTRTFGTQLVLARVEWHPPDFQNSVIHRGVTLYVPA